MHAANERWKYLKWGIVIATGLTLVAATCLHLFGGALVARHPELKDFVKSAQDIVVLFLLAEILAYLIEERLTVLRDVPTETRLRAIIDSNQDKLIDALARPSEITVYSTPEEVYRALKTTIDRVSGTVSGEKQMLHGILHTSLALKQQVKNTTLPQESYYSDFDEAITACVKSKGAGRWNVQQIYNITTLERLGVVEGRIQWGTEGYEVRGMVAPDLIPCFSPFVAGEEDAFLAIIDGPNYRVGAALHLHGREATQLITKYFRLLWDEGVRLRTEKGINEDGLDCLRQKLQMLAQAVKNGPAINEGR